jgi:hypothetical protein
VAAGESSAKEIIMAETDENPQDETGKDPAVATGKSSVAKTKRASAGGTTRKARVIETREDSITETGPESSAKFSADSVPETGGDFVTETKEESVVVSPVDPVAGIVEAALAEDFEVLEELGTEVLEEAESVASSFSGSVQMFATEASDYSKNCCESSTAFVGALLGAKSYESAVLLQASYAKSVYARFLAHLMKMSGLYWDLLGEASKPIEKLTARADRAKA